MKMPGEWFLHCTSERSGDHKLGFEGPILVHHSTSDNLGLARLLYGYQVSVSEH